MIPDPRRAESSKLIMQDFKLAWYALLAVVVPSFIIALVTDRYSFIMTWFANSRATPWGIFTSIFVHYDFWNHFVPNATFMAMFFIIFVSTNVGVGSDTRRGRSRFFLYVTFLGAIFVNALWIALVPAVSFGASGAIYASEDVMLAFATTNILPCEKSLDEWRAYYTDPVRNRLIVPNLLTFATFSYLIVANPSLFLASGPQVNVFVHGVGFCAAFLATLCYHWLKE